MIHGSSSSDARSIVLGLINALNDEGKTSAVLKRFSRSDALAKKVGDYRVAYPNFRIHPLDVFSERDLVIVRFILDLEGRYGAGRDAADPAPELLEAIVVCRVEAGAIAELWFEMDLFAQVIDRIGDPEEQGYEVPVDAAVASHADESVVANADCAPPADTSANRSLILRYLAALNNQHKTAELIARFATDTTLIEHVLAFEGGFPGYALLADEIVAEGDRVAVRFHTKQRHTQPFMGIPATGLDISITGIVIYRIEDGMIVRHWLQADTWTLLQRLQDGSPDGVPNSLADGLQDAARVGAEAQSTKRQFINRRVRGSEYLGVERRQPHSAIADR